MFIVRNGCIMFAVGLLGGAQVTPLNERPQWAPLYVDNFFKVFPWAKAPGWDYKVMGSGTFLQLLICFAMLRLNWFSPRLPGCWSSWNSEFRASLVLFPQTSCFPTSWIVPPWDSLSFLFKQSLWRKGFLIFCFVFFFNFLFLKAIDVHSRYFGKNKAQIN